MSETRHYVLWWNMTPKPINQVVPMAEYVEAARRRMDESHKIVEAARKAEALRDAERNRED